MIPLKSFNVKIVVKITAFKSLIKSNIFSFCLFVCHNFLIYFKVILFSPRGLPYYYNVVGVSNVTLIRASKHSILNHGLFSRCNMNALFSFDLFMVYIPECKQQLRTMK